MTTWRDAERYLSSLWLLEREDDRTLDFHGAFIPAVAEGLILRHTKPGDWIWDPMCGSGTTGIVATALGRNVFLSDLSPISAAEPVSHCTIRQADARTVTIRTGMIPYAKRSLEVRLPDSSFTEPENLDVALFDLVVLHPPYHDIIRFSDKPEDLSNAGSILRFYEMFQDVCLNVNTHLKPGGYVGLVVGDVWVPGEARVAPLGFGCICVAQTAISGARLKAIVVKNIEGNRHNAHRKNLLLSRFFRWGSVNFAHEYVFSIQKGG